MEPVEPIQELHQSGQTRPKDLPARIYSSLTGDAKPWMYLLLAAALAVRVWRASGTYLNPDEALHFSVANQATWWLTYTRSLILAHPPLLVLLLHAWRTVSSSEFMLRLPSILAGTAAGWHLPALGWPGRSGSCPGEDQACRRAAFSVTPPAV